MDNWLDRTELLIKDEGVEKLKSSNILIIGLGGVGSYAAEFIVRAGIGKLTIVDGDDVDNTNINRQLSALKSNIGKFKVDVMSERLLDINPELELTVLNEFLNPERMDEVITKEYDYVMDCIDSVTPKINLLLAAKRKKIKVISTMGAGGITDPSKIIITDISKTYHCPLARQIRKRLHTYKIDKGIRVVFSTESPDKSSMEHTDGKDYKRSFYGTISYMPALFGMNAAAEVLRYLLDLRKS
ncbi:MAG: tRNA threonylcarbamoyladenosine dehydratase [Flavobacteriales bacterium]|nr:tRNA threonylcarbamoyladenosine dehydratase [Flavobacteriales bacterium]